MVNDHINIPYPISITHISYRYLYRYPISISHIDIPIIYCHTVADIAHQVWLRPATLSAPPMLIACHKSSKVGSTCVSMMWGETFCWSLWSVAAAFTNGSIVRHSAEAVAEQYLVGWCRLTLWNPSWNRQELSACNWSVLNCFQLLTLYPKP